jgi:hypothetical protein
VAAHEERPERPFEQRALLVERPGRHQRAKVDAVQTGDAVEEPDEAGEQPAAVQALDEVVDPLAAGRQRVLPEAPRLVVEPRPQPGVRRSVSRALAGAEETEQLLVSEVPGGRDLESRQREVGRVQVDAHDRGGVGQRDVVEQVAAGRPDRDHAAGRLERERGQVDLGVLADPGVDQPLERGSEGALEQAVSTERAVPVDGAVEHGVAHQSRRPIAPPLSASAHTRAASAPWTRSENRNGLTHECRRSAA